METGELLRNIINLPIFSNSLAEEMLAGNFRSVFRGQGMEFDEARHYNPGDDIRSIDWNTSARFASPFVKIYREERELTILILLDVSPSMHRGYITRHGLSPYEQALLSAALIAFSAECTEQQVGAIFFDRDIEKVFKPRKGRKSIMALVMAALQYQNNVIPRRTQYGSDIASALAGAQRLLKKRSLVVLISDFYSINWEQEMGNLCRKHDCIALRICDPQELMFSGLITMEDPETGVRIEAPASLDSFRESWTHWHMERSTLWESQCRKSGASFMELSTETDAPSALIKFFGHHGISQKRKKR
ncbi:MAG: DUF58 domain-containing protein [Treponema sp.]|nr:DUF58 domain-containing protein [Treponema sp.]